MSDIIKEIFISTVTEQLNDSESELGKLPEDKRKKVEELLKDSQSNLGQLTFAELMQYLREYFKSTDDKKHQDTPQLFAKIMAGGLLIGIQNALNDVNGSTEKDDVLSSFYTDTAKYSSEIMESADKLTDEEATGIADRIMGLLDKLINAVESETIKRLEKLNAEIQSKQAQLEEIAPIADSLAPKHHVMLNDPITNKLQEKAIINLGEAVNVPVNSTTTAYVIAGYDADDANIKTAKKLTEYQRQVGDAIATLSEFARKEGIDRPIVTLDNIHRAMPGGSRTPTAQQKGALTRTIDYLRNINTYIDATDEMRKRKLIGEDATFKLDDKYLSLTKIEATTANNKNAKITAYQINREPLALTYCKMTNQRITLPSKCLEIREITAENKEGTLVKMNEERQAITGNIARRIGIIKRDRQNKKPRLSNHILFETIFEDAGLQDCNKIEKKRYRDFIFITLDWFKYCGFISGYKKLTGDKANIIKGVEILC